MSLINDALKRAQEAQSQAPSVAQPGPQLRPAEPTSYAWHGLGLLLPAALALAAVLVLFLLWEVSRHRAVQPQEVRATAAPAPVTESPQPAQPAEVPPPAPEPAPKPAGEAAPRPPAPGTPQVVAVAEAPTHTPAVTEEVKPLAAKLQAVIFNPRNPSAVINGRTVFRGDRLGSFRVTTITAYSATLVGDGQTNVLTLEH